MKSAIYIWSTSMVASGAILLLTAFEPAAVGHKSAKEVVSASAQPGKNAPVPDITGIAVSPDGKWLLVRQDIYAKSKIIYCVDLATGKASSVGGFNWQGYPKGIRSIAFSPDSKHFLTGSGDGPITLWTIVSGTEKRKYEGHQGAVTGLAWSSDGKSFLSASDDKMLNLWDAETGKVQSSIDAGSANPLIAMSGDAKWMIARFGNDVRVWDLTTKKLAHEFNGAAKRITAVDFSADGKLALAASADGSIWLWSVPQWKHVGTIEWPGSDKTPGAKQRELEVVNAATFTPDSNAILACYVGGVLLWDVETKKVIRTFEGKSTDWAFLALSANGKRAVTAKRNDTIAVWDIAKGEEVATLRTKSKGSKTSKIEALLFLPNNKQLVARGKDGAVLVDIQTEQVLDKLPLLNIDPWCVSADGQFIFSGTGVWDMSNKKWLWRLQKPVYFARALSPDGKKAIGGVFPANPFVDPLNSVELRDGTTGKLIRTIIEPGEVGKLGIISGGSIHL